MRSNHGLCVLRRTLLAVLLLLFCCAPLYAPSAEQKSRSVSLLQNDPPVHPVMIDSSNGLPFSEATAVLAAPDGSMYFGNSAGITRYDGTQFEPVDESLTGILCLFADSRGNVWAGTGENGVAVQKNGGTFQLLENGGNTPQAPVRTVAEDADGTILLGTPGGILAVDEKMQVHPLDIPQLETEDIRTLVSDAGGSVCGVTASGLVFEIRFGQLIATVPSSDLEAGQIQAICPDPAGRDFVWLADNESTILYGRLTAQGFKRKLILDADPVWSINALRWQDGLLCVLGENGIGYVQEGRFYPRLDLAMKSEVRDMAADYQGNLYFACAQRGVMKLAPTRFMNLAERYYIPEKTFASVCRYGDSLFMGTINEGVLILNPDREIEWWLPASMKEADGTPISGSDLMLEMYDCSVQSFATDSGGRLWMACNDGSGLWSLDGRKAVHFSVKSGLPSNRISALCARKDGTVAAACRGRLVILSGDKMLKTYGEDAGIPNTEILTVAEDSSGTLLLGTDGGGICAFKDGKSTHLGAESGLSSGVIRSIRPDRTRDLCWAVAGNSIACITPDLSIITIRNFPASKYYDLCQNSRDEMFVTSGTGIYVADTEKMLSGEPFDTVFHEAENGLRFSPTVNGKNYLDSDGMLYLPGTEGLFSFNTEARTDDPGELRIGIPYLETENGRIYPDADGGFTVPAKTKRIFFRPSVCHFSPVALSVSCQLKCYDDAPVTETLRELGVTSYKNLPGGTYEFEITAQIQDVGNAESPTVTKVIIPIRKHHRFYEILWVSVLIVLAAVAVIALVIHRLLVHRMHVYERRDKAQRQLIREIVEAFAKVIDLKDKYTNGHSTRVAEYTQLLAKELGLSEEEAGKYYCIALLHDIGKIGIPVDVLNKPGKLTDEEFKLIQSHTSLGHEVLEHISILPELAVGARSHHERPDGKGYPQGLKGDEIPRVAQIIAVADTFDAMYSNRPYRKRMNYDKAVSIIRENAGTQFAEDVVAAFLRLAENGGFRAPDDDGSGTVEDIDNIRRKVAEETAAEQSAAKISSDNS